MPGYLALPADEALLVPLLVQGRDEALGDGELATSALRGELAEVAVLGGRANTSVAREVQIPFPF